MVVRPADMPLQRRRKLAGLSLRDIALYSGLNRGTISLLERGRYIPTEEQLGRYMEVLADWESLIDKRGSAPFLTPEERAARTRARTAVNRAIRQGLLMRQPCERCGAEPTAAHHRHGYDRPLDVVWLCSKHHGMEHYDTMNSGRRDDAVEERRHRTRENALAVQRKYQGDTA